MHSLLSVAAHMLIDLPEAAQEAEYFTCRVDAEAHEVSKQVPFILPLLGAPGPEERR